MAADPSFERHYTLIIIIMLMTYFIDSLGEIIIHQFLPLLISKQEGQGKTISERMSRQTEVRVNECVTT